MPRRGPAPVPRSPKACATRAGHDDMVYAFGNASFRGSAAHMPLDTPVVAFAPTATGRGYWLLARDGGVFSFGAPFFGAVSQRPTRVQAVGIAATASGRGYWVAARDGQVFAFGDARHFASLRKRTAPIIAIVATPSGGGYWLLASDGGVFAFGGAAFYGSTATKRLKAPVVGMASTSSGRGYWLLASDGGVFTFGDAHFAGSLAGRHHHAVTGIAGDGTTRGYWVIANDGGVFSVGGAPFLGSAAPLVPSSARVVAVVGMPGGCGYRLLAVKRPVPRPAPTRAIATPPPRALAQPTPPQPPSPPVAITGGVTAIGDSVMIDAAPSLYALIPGVSVDASVSRQAAGGIGLLSALAASGRLRAAIIWHLGTNGSLTASEIDQVLQIAAGRPVVMVTDHCPYCSWTAGNNAAIYAGCSASRNCRVADWNALANANRGWFGSDGVHMAIGGEGARAYARLVASRL